MNQGETGLDCGGPCESCDNPKIIYIRQLSSMHDLWAVSLSNYTNSIIAFNEDRDTSALEQAAIASWGTAEVIRTKLVRTPTPEGLEELRDKFKRSLDLYMASLDNMVRYMKDLAPEKRSNANRFLADSTDNDKQFVILFNSMIDGINTNVRKCSNFLYDEGEDSVDCGGYCDTDCTLTFNVTKRVIVTSNGGRSSMTINVSTPAINYTKHQRILAEDFSPRPHTSYETEEGNRFLVYRFEMPNYGIREFDLTQTVELSMIIPPAMSDDEFFSLMYLLPTNQSPMTDDICFRAKAIGATRSGTQDKVRGIVSWIIGNIEYEANEEELGAESCYIRRIGACDEHADLFVSMARCIGIPSRRVTGSLYNDSKLAGHAWAEYFDQGWIFVDPSVKGLNRSFAPDNRHLFSCIGEGAYHCGVGYSFTYSGGEPNIDIEERVYIS